MRQNFDIDYVQDWEIGDLKGSDPKNIIHKKFRLELKVKIRLLGSYCFLVKFDIIFEPIYHEPLVNNAI
jgi:hypothetical protein